METIKKLYRIGKGPSSSHTMGPRNAAEIFKNKFPNASKYVVTLYGSLAATGKGHLTDQAILEIIPNADIVWKPETFLKFHPNGMKFEAFLSDKLLGEWTTYSVGGGELADENSKNERISIYPLSKMNDILSYCADKGITFWEFVKECEGEDIFEYLKEVWEVMKKAVERGLDTEGVLPGGLKYQRRAPSYYIKAKSYKTTLQSRCLVFSYALAVAEENASGGLVVTAPTCGSSGVLPSVLYHLHKAYDFPESKLLRALATAGLIGNLIKENASISGAQVGCQGEIGSACSMAAAAATQLFGGTREEIEYAAEMGLEHHLGLTCDPVCGLVQIPCIERNGFAAARALDANIYATISDGRHLVSFDRVVSVMKQTGHDIPSIYKETAEGGLAKYTQN